MGTQSTLREARIPMPLIGTKGMRYLSRRMRHWPERLGNRKASQWLGNVIRMQEEIGTGGAGFRFIYAAFLDQASNILKDEKLFDLSRQLTRSGDQLREFAYFAGRLVKNRTSDTRTYAELADMFHSCAEQEQKIFSELYSLSKSK